MKLTILLPGIFFFLCCQPQENPDSREIGQPIFTLFTPADKLADGFKDYWYQGKAEICRYELSQNRYGDIHPGYAVMIFVTEDFLPEKQVKDDGSNHSNSISVLKNNQIRKFNTGIYRYSMMNSVFTPVENNNYRNTLKISSSSQEWCGHTYMQLNLRDDQYAYERHSYFEREADENGKLRNVLLEDEIYNRIRMNPSSLPTGEMEMIPSLFVIRFMHLDVATVNAQASLQDYAGSDFSGTGLRSYRIEFPSLNRELEIVFESEFPFKVLGWKDTYSSGFNDQPLTTIAKMTHERFSAYWDENGMEDANLRKELGLE